MLLGDCEDSSGGGLLDGEDGVLRAACGLQGGCQGDQDGVEVGGRGGRKFQLEEPGGVVGVERTAVGDEGAGEGETVLSGEELADYGGPGRGWGGGRGRGVGVGGGGGGDGEKEGEERGEEVGRGGVGGGVVGEGEGEGGEGGRVRERERSGGTMGERVETTE